MDFTPEEIAAARYVQCVRLFMDISRLLLPPEEEFSAFTSAVDAIAKRKNAESATTEVAKQQ